MLMASTQRGMHIWSGTSKKIHPRMKRKTLSSQFSQLFISTVIFHFDQLLTSCYRRTSVAIVYINSIKYFSVYTPHYNYMIRRNPIRKCIFVHVHRVWGTKNRILLNSFTKCLMIPKYQFKYSIVKQKNAETKTDS